MNARLRLTLIMPLAVLMVGCTVLCSPTSTPPSGWRTPVSELLVDESAFPEDWQIGFPEDTATNPKVNHVGREWWGPPTESGIVLQSIWRAYTVADAKEKYSELRASQFEPSRPLHPSTVFVPFEPPAEVNCQSQVADEFYLACGWWGVAYCEVIARYRNYVTEMRLEREAKHEGHVSEGLTYSEIEAVVRAMDAKFVAAIEEFYPASP